VTARIDPAEVTRRAEFARRLLRWFGEASRDLPWRKTRDPYAIWISETMLQQTQVATVIPYWTRWMSRFPTVRALAEAPLEDVLQHWQGLGYYARARNLHRAAGQIVERHGGVFPHRFEDVLALPGVGRYTAGAVCSIALDQDVPIVDANAIRVLCRVWGVRGDPKSSRTQAALWDLAAALVPPGRAADFNPAVMELGALICQPAPRCGACPVRDLCVAYASGDPTALPEFAPRPVFTDQTDVSALLPHPADRERLLLVQRPAEGLWGGLWEFPRVTLEDGETPEAGAERACREIVGVAARAGERIGVVKHGVTTRRITLLGIACAADGEEPRALGCAAWAWVSPDEIERYARSSPQVRLLAQVRARREQPTLFAEEPSDTRA
jgi:A/G-specific adenine glycosylase